MTWFDAAEGDLIAIDGVVRKYTSGSWTIPASVTTAERDSIVGATIGTRIFNSTTNRSEELTETGWAAAGSSVALLAEHVADTENPHAVTKAQVGLANVDNTADALKPISTATQVALNAKADLVEGVVPEEQLPPKADLVAGKVPSSQLPSYVDDIIEAADLAAIQALTLESAKIYVALDSNKAYRWTGSGTNVVEVSAGVQRYMSNFGDGSTTTFTFTHNFGTRDVIATVYRNSADYDEPLAEIRHATTNTVVVVCNSAPSSDQYRIVVIA